MAVGEHPRPKDSCLSSRGRPLAVIVAGLLVGLGAAPSATANAAGSIATAAPACPPAAAVQGPPEIVGPIVAILSSHGIGAASRACGARSVKASLVAYRDAEGYRLQVLDAVGHSNVRQVADAATAASLIESWALGEDAEVWGPRPGVGEGAGLLAQAATSAPDGAAASAVVRIGAAAETTIGGDAFWWGASARACARFGALCLGGRAGVARAETTLEIDRALGIAPDLTRTLGGLSAFVAWPLSAGRFWLAPSLGLGAAWLRSRAFQAQVTSTSNDLLARGDAGAVVGVTLGRGWSVALALDASVALVIDGNDRRGTTTYIPAVPRGLLTTGVGVWYAP